MGGAARRSATWQGGGWQPPRQPEMAEMENRGGGSGGDAGCGEVGTRFQGMGRTESRSILVLISVSTDKQRYY
jgi:hypothetical protein